MTYQRYSIALWILVAGIGLAGFMLFASHSPVAHAGYTGPSQVGGWPTQPADGPYDPSIGGCREYSGGMAVIPADNQAWCSYYDDTTQQFMCFYCATPNTMPNVPYIGGPTSIYTNTPTTYGVYATDPDGDNVLYYLSFGDGGAYQSSYVPSGTAQYTSHSWSSPGSYTLDAVAYDGSLWSYHTYLTVNVISPPPPACTPNYSASASTCPTSYYSDGCGNWYQGTAYCPVGIADLITNASLPTLSATVGVPVTLTAPATNQGSGSTGRSFWSEFIIGNNPGSWYNDVSGTNVAVPALAAYGGSTNVSISKTFNSVGSYYYQFCANYYNMWSWSNDVSESNYSNNCDQVAGIVNVAAAVPPGPTNPQAICSPSGASVTVSWSPSAGATNYYPRFQSVPVGQCPAGWQVWTDGVTCYPNPDTWTSTSVSNFPINPGQSYTWYSYAGTNGNVNWNAPVVGTFMCTAPTPTCSLTASPSTLSNGQSTTLTWTSTNTNSCTGSGFSTGGAKSGSVSATPGSLPISYGLSCAGTSGATCNAAPAMVGNSCSSGGSLTEAIAAAPARLGTAGSVNLSYSASNVLGSSCTVTGTDGYSATYPTNACSVANTSVVRPISKQTTYTITCDGVSKSVTVNFDPSFKEF